MDKPHLPALNRRTALAGAGAVGAVGALAAVATSLPGTPAPAATKTVQAEPTGADGYQLTDHVKHYYATARV